MHVIIALLLTLAVASSLPVNNNWENVIRHRRNVANCAQPDNIDELFASLNQHINASMFLRPTWAPYSHESVELGDVSTLDLGQDKTCPSQVSSDPNAAPSQRSLCPWYYNITLQPAGIYPRTIPNAVCKCKDCVGNNINECELISTTIYVLEEAGCQNGFIQYIRKAVSHDVGCMCVKRRVVNTTPPDLCGDFC